MGTLAKRYKKYYAGGPVQPGQRSPTAAATGWNNPNLAAGIGAAGSMVGTMADTLGPADRYGQKSMGSSILGGAGKGAAMGAVAGPWGAAIGGVVGGVVGAFSTGEKKAKKLRGQEAIRNAQLTQQQTAARVNADPSIVYGSQGTLMNGYFAAGGHLNVANQTIENGTATRLNSTSAEFNGPSHAQGGIQIPGMAAEVEGNETTNGSYVFSDKLGFAKLHRPIASAIGKIEKKALSPERISSVKLLKEKENQLKLSQEYTKQMLGLN